MRALKDEGAKPCAAWAGLVLLLLIFFLAFGLMVFPSSIPQAMQQTLSIDSTELGVLVSSFYLAAMIMQIPAGLMLDRYPIKVPVTLAALLIAAGCILMAVTNLYMLSLLGRMLIGAGYAFTYLGCLVYGRNVFVSHIFPVIVGLTGAVAGLGAISMSVIFGALIQQFSWQHIIAVIGGGCIVLLCLVIGTINHSTIESCEQEYPIVNQFTLLFQRRRILLAAAFVLCGYALYAVVVNLWGVTFIEREYHVSNESAIWVNAFAVVGFTIGCPVLGFLAKNINSMKIIVVFAVLQMVVLIFMRVDVLGLHIKSVLIFILGMCAGSITLIMNVIKSYAPIRVYGLMAAVINIFFFGSAFVFTPLVSWLYHNETDKNAAILPVIICSALAVMFAIGLYLVDKKYPIEVNDS